MIRALWIEVAVMLAVSLLGTLLSTSIGYSLFLGSAVYAVPHVIFTLMSLRRIGDGQSAALLLSVAVGFVGKLLLMGLGLALIFTQDTGAEPLPLMMAVVGFYVLGQIVTGILSSMAATAAEEA